MDQVFAATGTAFRARHTRVRHGYEGQPPRIIVKSKGWWALRRQRPGVRNPFGCATFQVLSGSMGASRLLRKQDGSSRRKAFGQFVALSAMASGRCRMASSRMLGWPASLSAQPCQGWGRGFESLRPLQISSRKSTDCIGPSGPVSASPALEAKAGKQGGSSRK